MPPAREQGPGRAIARPGMRLLLLNGTRLPKLPMVMIRFLAQRTRRQEAAQLTGRLSRNSTAMARSTRMFEYGTSSAPGADFDPAGPLQCLHSPHTLCPLRPSPPPPLITLSPKSGWGQTPSLHLACASVFRSFLSVPFLSPSAETAADSPHLRSPTPTHSLCYSLYGYQNSH